MRTKTFAASVCALLAGGLLATTARPAGAVPFGAVISDQQMKLVASDARAAEYFGSAVAIDGDTAVIGAPRSQVDGSAVGAAYVYVRTGGTWTQQQKLVAADRAVGDGFGTSVALSGDTAVIGAPNDRGAANNEGSAYVFLRSGATWTQQQKLTAADAASGDEFGSSVAVADGTAVVGAPYDDVAAPDQGSAYVFTRSGVTWAQLQRLVAGDPVSGDRFGASVAISGTTALIGAPDDDGNTTGDQGSAYVFSRYGSSWTQRQKFFAVDGTDFARYGSSVSLSGDTALVGAPGDDAERGAAYVITRDDSYWSQQQKLVATDRSWFGSSVAVNGDTALIGAVAESNFRGSAYVFVRDGNRWNQAQRLAASDGADRDNFGFAVATDGHTALVGAPYDYGVAVDQGGAYVFVPGAFSVSDARVTEGTGGLTSASFTVRRTGTTAIQAYVNVDTISETANTDVDFDSVSTTLSFPAGVVSRTITVPVSSDSLDEADEAFRVVLSSPSGALIGDGSGRGTIVDDDDPSTLSITAPPAVTETDTTQVPVDFTVTRSGSAGGAVSVEARTVNGTATAPDDFDHVVRTVRWVDGETGPKTFTVLVDPDNLTENVERFYAKLTNVVGPATIAVGAARATINDDDAAPAPSLAVNSPSLLEADTGTRNILFKVTRTGSTTNAITFNYSTANGTAVAPGDYTAKTGTATIAAGATFVNVAVVTVGDTAVEPNETFTLTITNATGGATITTPTGTGTITNED